MPLTRLIPASRPDIEGGRAMALALAVTAALVVLGGPGVVVAAFVISGDLPMPASLRWLPLAPVAVLVPLLALTTVRAWRNVLVLPSRRRLRFERLLDDRIVYHDGLHRAPRALLLHDARIEVRSREDYLRRTKFRIYRHRMLIELVAPYAGRRGKGSLLLADLPARHALTEDPPAQVKPPAELAAIAAAVAGSPLPACRRAAQDVRALIPGPAAPAES